jgi:hypothetical protein
MDRGLCPVLRTRPGYSPPHLPALYLSIRGIPVRRPTLLPPASFRCALRLTPLPLATLRLHQAGSGLYLKYVSLFQISPFSSRAVPGTQQGTKAQEYQDIPSFRNADRRDASALKM